MMDLDLNLLRVLVALDRTRHLGRAAESLQMSQSGFSTALARLRRQLDDDLFVRSAGGMRPTPRATALAATARAVLQQLERDVLGTGAFNPARSSVRFRVSMSDVAESVFMPTLLRHLERHAPGTGVQVVSPHVAPLQERLAAGEVDLAIGYFPGLEQDALYRQALYSHTYACLVRRGHPVLREGLTRASYQALGHIVVSTPARSGALLDSALERLRIRRRAVLSTPNHLALPASIASTDLVATVPLGTAIDFARSHALEVLPLPFRPPVFTLHQYWHARTHKDVAGQWLRQQIKALFNADTDPYARERAALYPAGARPRKADTA